MSPRMKPLLLPLTMLIMLVTLPLPAIASSAATPVAKLELKQLNGLKSLFKRLHRRVEQRFKEGALSPTALSASDSYSRLASRYSSHEQKQLRAEYSQLVGQWQQFQIVAAHVLGDDTHAFPLSYANTYDAFLLGKVITLPVAGETRAKDRFVERMALLGYTSKEIADVVSGRLSLRTLQKSDRMRALGYAREAITAYLERHYTAQPVSVATTGSALPSVSAKDSRLQRGARSGTATPRQQLEQYVMRHARTYGIDPNLVRAIIANESSWRVNARSSVGAIGLMQLMPTTAQMLGIDPHNPEQNIEGGVRYLAGLVDMFEGDLDAALVSYNAGPSHARKWRKGDTVLYGETRNYLQRVKQSYAKLKL